MKRVLLLTTIGIFCFILSAFSQNVMTNNDPVYTYNSAAVAGSNTNPNEPAYNQVGKWVRTNRNLGWNTDSFKCYIFNSMAFRIRFPKTYATNPAKKYPVIVFWHGGGEIAPIRDNEFQLLHGAQLFSDRVQNGEFDGFLIFPQQTAVGWEDTYFQRVNSVIDTLIKYNRLDEDKVISMGLSIGGNGTLGYTSTYPKRVAKAIPSCPSFIGSFTSAIPAYLEVPIWVGSGGKDPNPDSANVRGYVETFKNQGGNIKWNLYPTLGHNMWYYQWNEPILIPEWNSAHKANPLVYYGRNEFCPDSAVTAKLAVTAGFNAYEWQKDNVTIGGATSNVYLPTTYGTYRVRFQRVSGGAWSDWSPNPVVIGVKPATNTPAIKTTGGKSRALPSLDGSTSVTLELPAGYVGYEWRKVSDNAVVSTARTFTTSNAGSYKATVKEQFGCNANFSPIFNVVNANGSQKPDKAKNLSAFALSGSSVQLDWNKNATSLYPTVEFEIYRATQAGGPYQIIGITDANTLSFTDKSLLSNRNYYYVIRAINETGAAAVSNEAKANTRVDATAPTAPSNVRVVYQTRQYIELAWDTAADNIGVIKYDVYINGTKSYSIDAPATTFKVYNLKELQSYNIVIKARDEAGNSSPNSNQVTAGTFYSGVRYKYYEGDWDQLPNFNNIIISKEGNTPNFDLNVRNAGTNDYFGFVWEGFLIVPATANYKFRLNSDDGSRFYLGTFYNPTATPTVDFDGIHGTVSDVNRPTSSVINLTAGAYPFALTFFDKNQSQSIELEYQIDNGTWVTVPNTAFNETATVAGTLPAAPTSLIATATAFNKINLSWTDNSGANETGFEITRSATLNGEYLPTGTTNANVNSYVDSTLSPSTTYYYKVRAVGTAGQSAYTTAANATTTGLPSAPATPTGLGLTVISTSQINLSWTDNSTETGFEIYRSSNNNSNYRLLQTVAANTTTYQDGSGFANVTYYYKVRSIVAGNSSAYSNEVFGKTKNTLPVINDVPYFTMKYGTTKVVNIVALDNDNDDMIFTYKALPRFATFVNTGNGNGNLVLNPLDFQMGSYKFRFYVSDPNGGKDTMEFGLVVNNNNPPVLNTINNISINEGAASTIINVSATDIENTATLKWSFQNLPSFVTFTDNTNGNGVLNINPGYAAAGTYTITAVVDDSYGGVSSSNFNITVVDQSPNVSWKVNIKGSNAAAPLPWNNMTGASISNLINNSNSATTVGVNINPTWGFSIYQFGPGTGNNSGYYPDNVLIDNLYTQAGIDTLAVQVTGLNPAALYNFKLMAATTNPSETVNSQTGFKIGNKTTSVFVKNNTQSIAIINGSQPDAAGNVLVKLFKTNAQSAYLNAFEFEAIYNDGTVPAKPLNFAGAFTAGNGVKLTWKDIAYNETSYVIYRSALKAGPYTVLNAGAINPNDTSYIDLSANANSSFYYYLLASNSIGNAASTDTINISTGNNPPVVTAINDIYVKANTVASTNFSVSDDAGDVLTVTATSLPPFITLSQITAGNWQISAAPARANIGWYYLTVNVTDDKGVVTQKKLRVIVSDNDTKTILVKFGGDGFGMGAPWNNISFSYPQNNLQVNDMKDDTGGATTVDLKLTTDFYSFFGGGFNTGNNSGAVPDSALISGISEGSSTIRTFTLSGLTAGKTYSLGFVSSINDGRTATMTFSSQSKSVTTDARYNANLVPRLNGLIPDASGNIVVSVQRTAGNTERGFFNALIIDEFTAAAIPVSPTSLFAEPTGRTSVKLTWSDRADNETAYQVFRATSLNGTYAQVGSNLPVNTTSFTDNTVNENTRYFYNVKAINGANVSLTSNVASTITTNGITYINFKNTVPGGTTIWNNTGKTPVAGDVYNNLKNDKGAPTGFELSIINNFSGVDNAGSLPGTANTGVFPDSVLASNFTLNRYQLVTIKIAGLDQSKRYRIGFGGSNNNQSEANTTMAIGNRIVYLNAFKNTVKAVYIGDVQPDSNGEVLVNFSTPANEANVVTGFVAGLIIQGYTETAGANEPGTIQNRVISGGQNIANTNSLVEVTNVTTIKAYPNPFDNNIVLDITSAKAVDKATVQLFDINGRIAYRNNINIRAGKSNIQLNLGNIKLTTGNYFLQVLFDNTKTGIIKLLKNSQ
jgi:large repetitive protein